MTPLPRAMVAPNGARLTRALPVMAADVAACARACRDAGADMQRIVHDAADVARLGAAGHDRTACASGPRQTACLTHAARHGGTSRIGFDDNRLNADGAPAAPYAAQVSDLLAQTKTNGFLLQAEPLS